MVFYEDSEARGIQTIVFYEDSEARSVQTNVFYEDSEARSGQDTVFHNGFEASRWFCVLKDKNVFYDGYHGPLCQHFGSFERSKSCWEALWNMRVITIHVINTFR